MYHSFQAIDVNEHGGGNSSHTASSSRITTTNACGSCRRRKIRCDGALPCGQCIWYRQSDSCIYNKPKKRVMPTRRLIDSLSNSVELYRAVFSRLFPGKDIEHIASLSREEMITTLTSSPGITPSPDLWANGASPEKALKTEDAESLEALSQQPDQEPVLDEAEKHKVKVQGISDDVNGLSLSVGTQSSYVGASSIIAALKVIFKIAPGARQLVTFTHTETALPTRSNSPISSHNKLLDPIYVPVMEAGHALIETYFKKVHLLMPMIDEKQFWHIWRQGKRRDAPWLALLNAVLALGSMASSNAESRSHIIYFQRARHFLNVESFGSGNLLMVQAFGLISGYYLHYANRPNLANNLMGATLRQATVLGLHREYTSTYDDQTIIGSASAEVRRHTWWTLFVLDCWASTTTGRPSLGQLGSSVTIQPPEIKDLQGSESLKLLPLIKNVYFCKIATRIQDALAASPLLDSNDLAKLDVELLQWHADLPSILLPVSTQTQNPFRSPETVPSGTDCPDMLRTPRAIMHWRYQNLRMLLYRPYLLVAALHRAPCSSLSEEEKIGVDRCREIASSTISDIIAMSEQELISGWNAVWFMYQAVMVPLVSLFSVLSTPASSATSEIVISDEPRNEVKAWQVQIESALRFFDTMERWSVAAKRSKEIVARLYDASKRLGKDNARNGLATHGYDPRHEVHVLPPEHSKSIIQARCSSNYIETTQSCNPQGHNIDISTTNLNIDHTNIWDTSPSEDSSMNNLWFDDLMWDVPAAGFDMSEMSGTSIGDNGLDWYSTLEYMTTRHIS